MFEHVQECVLTDTCWILESEDAVQGYAFEELVETSPKLWHLPQLPTCWTKCRSVFVRTILFEQQLYIAIKLQGWIAPKSLQQGPWATRKAAHLYWFVRWFKMIVLQISPFILLVDNAEHEMFPQHHVLDPGTLILKTVGIKFQNCGDWKTNPMRIPAQ